MRRSGTATGRTHNGRKVHEQGSKTKSNKERSKERSTDKPAAWLACRIQVWSHSASYYRKRLDGDSPKREAEELEENSIFVQPYAFLIPFSQSQDEVA